MTWYPSLAYVGMLLGPVVFILLAIVLQRNVGVTAGLCEEHARVRRKGLLVGWLGSLTMIGLIVAALIAGNENLTELLLLVGIGGLLAFILYGSMKSRILWPKTIHKDRAVLNGAGEEFLAQLPEYPLTI